MRKAKLSAVADRNLAAAFWRGVCSADTLGVVEDVVWIGFGLDRPQARQVLAPIGLLPVRKVGVQIVHMGAAGRAAHGGVEAPDIGEAARSGGVAGPACVVLDAELRALAIGK